MGSVLLLAATVPPAAAEIPPESQLELAHLSFLDRRADAETFYGHLLSALDLDATQSRKLLEHLVNLERRIDAGAVQGRKHLDELLEAKRQLRDVLLLEDGSDPERTDAPMSRVLVAAMAWRKHLDPAEVARAAAVDDLENTLSEPQKQALGAANIDQYLYNLGVSSQEIEECARLMLASVQHAADEKQMLEFTQGLLEERQQMPSPENLENVMTWFQEFHKLSEADRSSFLARYARELRESLHPSTASVAASETLTGEALHDAVRSNIEQYLLDVRMIPVLQKRIETSPPAASPSPGNR